MKKLSYFFIAVIIMTPGCTTKTLDEPTAIEVISKDYPYPRIVDHDIFCGDPTHAYKILQAGLEAKGLVTILQIRKFGDTTSFVKFTNAAKPYLLPTPKEDRIHKIQRVKVADEEFGAIKNIAIMSSKNKAIVSYTVIRKKTVFADAMKNPMSDTLQRKAYFIRTDDGWQTTKNSELDFLAF